MNNTFSAKLSRGERPIGTFFELGVPSAMEALGQTGLDFVIIDNEHGPFEAESSADFVRAAELAGITPLARVRESSRPALLKLLDVGAQGLIVPDVHSVDQVRSLVDFAKYSPLGMRGFCPSRKDGWGFSYPATEDIATAMAWHNSNTLLIPQCETVGCLENIEAISALPGVDGIFVGPFDLSISMGIPGQFEHPDFQAALRRILAACKKASKFSIFFTVDASKVADGFRMGFDAMTYSLDARVIIEAFRKNLAEIRGKM